MIYVVNFQNLWISGHVKPLLVCFPAGKFTWTLRPFSNPISVALDPNFIRKRNISKIHKLHVKFQVISELVDFYSFEI